MLKKDFDKFQRVCNSFDYCSIGIGCPLKGELCDSFCSCSDTADLTENISTPWENLTTKQKRIFKNLELDLSNIKE